MTRLEEVLAELAEARKVIAAAEARVQVLEMRERAREVLAGATTGFAGGRPLSSLEVRGLLADLPLTEAGALDEAALVAAAPAACPRRSRGRGP